MVKKINIAVMVLIIAAILFLLFVPSMVIKTDETIEKIELVLDEDYYGKYRGQNKSVIVYNWGEYISNGADGSLDVNKAFTEATGINVTYLTFSTNEELYAKLRSGNSGYDVIIPSDYMIGRMITENMLQPLNKELLINTENIDPQFITPSYDPDTTYSLPYTWGITGIIYNTQLVNDGDEVDSWDILWDEKYKNDILMFSNSRDAFGIAQKKLGYSLNTVNPRDLEDALRVLKEQKPLVQAFVMDEIFDKMLGGEAALAPYYAGDALTMIEDNPNLNFAIPKEGVNIFVDAAVIPKDAPNVATAHMYISFLMEAQVAAANSEYIGYATPNLAAKAYMDEEVLANPIAYPPQEVLDRAEFFLPQTREMSLLMDQYWTELLTDDQQYNRLLVPVLMSVAIIATIAINLLRSQNKKRKHQYF